jgi:cytochrome c biogenesis factor
MFVEIALIQKMILPLENPSYAIATVLSSILISSGIGSLLGDRFSLLRSPFILPMISLLILLCSVLLPLISDAISLYPMPLRIACVFFVLFLPCLLMGIPFPLGIRNLGTRAPDMIPWAWATNGCLAVLAPMVTIMLAMAVGFNAVLWIGAGAYVLAFLTFPMSEDCAG